MTHPLLALAPAHRAGQRTGITSVCSAHPVAIEATLRYRAVVTRDVGGTASTDEYTDAVIARLKG